MKQLNPILLLYLINTIIFLFPLWKQAQILFYSPEDDPQFYPKLFFFVFNICILTAMWLGYARIPEAAWFFFLIAICIAYFTYHHNNNKKPNDNARPPDTNNP